MHLDHLPPCPTPDDTAPHAHPLPADAVQSTDPIQRLEDLAASLPLYVQLHGLAAAEQRISHDAYHPRVRRSALASYEQADKTTAVQHIDTIASWRGLSNPQAYELVFWETAFRECLTSQVEHALRIMIAAQIAEQQKPAAGLAFLLDLNERLASLGSQVISVDGARLINSMMSLFYEEEPYRAGRSLTWGVDSENLPRFLGNFIRTQDCFLRDVDAPKVFIDKFTYEYSYPVFNITAEVAWLPPHVKFDGVPASVEPEGIYIIAPTYVEAALPLDGSPIEPYPDRLHYTITQSNAAAQWDSDDSCFRMLAPAPILGMGTSETTVCTTILTFFPGNVFFERCSRYRIVVGLTSGDASLGTTSSVASCKRDSRSSFDGSYISPPIELSSKSSQVNPHPLEKDSYDSLVHHLDSIARVDNITTCADAASPRKRKAHHLLEPDTGDTIVCSSLRLESSSCDMGSSDGFRGGKGRGSPPRSRRLPSEEENTSVRRLLQHLDNEHRAGSSSSNGSSGQVNLPVIPNRSSHPGRIIPRESNTPEVQVTAGPSAAQRREDTSDSSESPPLKPITSNDGNVDAASLSPVVCERRDSMEPELRQPVTRLRTTDIPQEQIQQNFRELLETRRGPMHNDDFIDVFTDTDVEYEDEEWLSDASSDDDEMEDVCSDE
ncbi:hypothetical protein T440DRAFT_527505 [Plenodomus tracheiphilus IPT5]|uniref:Uncharacterized protein n=1 Tax=Plenodomus tracheiphilus IPT5 TaxID=1408161 RepID=A0A6A7B8W9_9PLEO|nr:hypothetical protein T440DRAFT_527505 [Plenodomus tracheiphilus IPT5]